jgi:uncharacterized protein DUF2625
MPERSLSDLIDTHDSAWPLVWQWIIAAPHPVEVLPAERDGAEHTLLALQVTTRSPLGAIALEAGGILVDHGWLRILSSGHDRMHDTLLSWNGLTADPPSARLEGAFIVAHDAVGGFFALNGGAFDGTQRGAFYFAPDTLRWEDLGLSYSDLIAWAMTDRLTVFYGDVRWPGWERDVAVLRGDQGFSIYPPLWSKGVPVENRSRRPVPMGELWATQRDLARQLEDVPAGTPIRLKLTDDKPGAG